MTRSAQIANRFDVPVARFGYNPSGWRERILITLGAMLAFFIAVYLALYQWRLIPFVWDPIFGEQSHAVLDSDVSHQMKAWFGIPDAALGAYAYLVDAVLCLAGSTRRWQYRPWVVFLFGIAVIPLGIVSATLVALQGTIVGAWCFLCLVTAAISLWLVWMAYDEVWLSLLLVWGVWKRTRSVDAVWQTLWGRPSRVAAEVAQGIIEYKPGQK
jgi:uncharacterized membrane protein